MLRAPLVTAWLLATASAAVLSLVVATNGIAVAILYVTCGLGAPVLLAPTFAVYLACLGPAALSARRSGWWLGASLSIAAALAVAFLPPRISAVAVAAEDARATRGDTAARLADLPRTLELVRPSSEDPNLDAPVFGGDLCGPACRALLLGGEVDWVRVVSLSWSLDGTPTKEDGRVRLVRATGCDAPDAQADIGAGCVIFVPDIAEPAGLVLRFEDGSGEPDRSDARNAGARWAVPAGWRRATATRAGATAPAPRRTEVRLSVVYAPTLLVARVRGMTSGGIEMSRVAHKHGEVTLAGVLRDLGYLLVRLDAELALASTDAHPLKGPPDEESTRRLVSILDLPGEEPFAPAQQQLVANWLAAARAWSHYDGWTPPRIELVRRITADPRVRNAWPLDQLVERTPAVAAAVLPDVIARTEALGLVRDAPWQQAWYGLVRADPAVLHPHTDRIAALVDAYPDPLVGLSGRLGIDPTRWLVPIGRGDVREGSGLDRRLGGACRAESQWSPELIEPLRTFLTQLDIDAPSGLDRAEAAARALVRHGDAEGARERLTARGEAAARTWRRVESDLRRVGTTDAICR
jgi:hypothetical protein